MDNENTQRVEILYNKHNNWLHQVAMNICHNDDESNDMLQDLYLYLMEKGNEKLWFNDSFNLKYCYLFIKSRFTNKFNYSNSYKLVDIPTNFDVEDEEYNYLIDSTYDKLKDKLKKYSQQKQWTASRIFELVYLDGEKKKSYKEVAEELDLSVSTIVGKVNIAKEKLSKDLENPFI